MRIWDKESIQKLLAENDEAVRRAILAIYERQEDAEKGGSAKYRNGVGFGAFDAEYFCMRARDILGEGFFSHYLAEGARRRGISRYWRQLVEIANENEMRKVKVNATTNKQGA